MFKKTIPVLALGLITASTGFAAMPLITDDTGTQGTGGNQIEISLGEDRITTAGVTDKSRQLPALSYTRGITEALDLFASATWLENSSTAPLNVDARGSGNPGIGAKWRVFENERKTSFALKGVYLFPVSEEKQTAGLGAGEASWDGTLIMSQELPFGSAHANIGAGKVGIKNGPDEKTTHLSVAPIFNFSESFKLAFDLGEDTGKPDGGTKTTSRYWEAGVMYSPHKDIDLALGYIHAKDKGAAEATKSVTGGVTWRF